MGVTPADPGDGVTPLSPLSPDHQKLEREARICRLLKHSNIGEWHPGTHGGHPGDTPGTH